MGDFTWHFPMGAKNCPANENEHSDNKNGRITAPVVYLLLQTLLSHLDSSIVVHHRRYRINQA